MRSQSLLDHKYQACAVGLGAGFRVPAMDKTEGMSIGAHGHDHAIIYTIEQNIGSDV